MFIRAFNHEIRHPLNSIQTLSTLEEHKLEKNQSEKEGLMNSLRIMRNESFSLQLLSQNLHGYQDIQNENFSLQFKRIEIKQIIDSAVDLIAFQAKRRGLQVITKVQANLSCISDFQRVLLVLFNLLQNALKYT